MLHWISESCIHQVPRFKIFFLESTAVPRRFAPNPFPPLDISPLLDVSPPNFNEGGGGTFYIEINVYFELLLNWQH